MSFKELLESWHETAAEPHTAAQYAVRLPLDDAARLQALAQMFPGRTTEQLITLPTHVPGRSPAVAMAGE